MATMHTPSAEDQYNYIADLAADYNAELTDDIFVLDRKYTPKREFTRFAIRHSGWVGGDALWCQHWETCFGEKYPYKPKAASIADGSDANVLEVSHLADISDTDIGRISKFLRSGATVSSQSSSSSSSSSIGTSANALIPSLARGKKRFRLIDERMNEMLGTDYSNFAAWQKLCNMCGIDPAPESIKKCRKAIQQKYINIYDFVEGHPYAFPTFRMFVEYTIGKNKIYPLELAKKDSFTRALLHEIFVHKLMRARFKKNCLH
ncbi:hypothetical protein BU23DRAFT_551796 [Bimuria novae-zelandiae CBS 107.79]|uniref:Uncharacterized protein n=1 Tax=Bimuria novae-zelandiae CBS 107.79 TaxID=1447943 RepID=A0A6A5VMZ3_9PLEO|nr:hypothetical protein BU23DRAFT_551796 [Bimuria novae-zelandiae CBS 107.79]